MTKSSIRANALNNRRGLDSSSISKNIINDIVNSNIINSYNKIGIYYPIKNEINPLELISIYKDKSFYLPRINKDNKLEFALYNNNLKEGKYNIMEPTLNAIDINELDLIIIPCVALANGRRIGYGKGYYDKALKNYLGYKIGLVYSNAIFDLELEEYDILLDKVFKGD